MRRSANPSDSWALVSGSCVVQRLMWIYCRLPISAVCTITLLVIIRSLNVLICLKRLSQLCRKPSVSLHTDGESNRVYFR